MRVAVSSAGLPILRRLKASGSAMSGMLDGTTLWPVYRSRQIFERGRIAEWSRRTVNVDGRIPRGCRSSSHAAYGSSSFGHWADLQRVSEVKEEGASRQEHEAVRDGGTDNGMNEQARPEVSTMRSSVFSFNAAA